MNRIKAPNLSDLLLKALPLVALALSVMSTLSGCGVRQFGAKITALQAAKSETVGAYGPFYSAGQGSGSMSAGSCATGPGHHPCARARASVGMPYQFDVNPNSVQGPITTGATYSAPAAYTGGAAGSAGLGAGKTQAVSADRPRMENRDLHLMKNQAPAASQTF